MKNHDEDKTGLRKGLTSYGDLGFSLFLRKAFIKGAGYTDDVLDRPIVAIINTGSDYNPCHGNATQLIEAVKRGVMLAGGLPIEAGGSLLGGIGVSGAPGGDKDEACAKAGLDSVRDRIEF